MKRILLLLLASALTLCAQNPPEPPAQSGQQPAAGAAAQEMTNYMEHVNAPTYTDMHCSGYVSKQAPNASNYVISSKESPASGQFAQGDTLFLTGSGYQEGARYSVVRATQDPNKMEMFPGQHAAMLETGQPYANMGIIRVQAIRGNTTLAVVEFSCSAITAGDYVVPFQEPQQVSFRPASQMNEWPSDTPAVAGRIIMAKDFDAVVATGHKVYLNVGADKGVKPGDYFRIVRYYDPKKLDQIEAFSYRLPQGDEYNKNALKVPPARYKEFPRLAVGEAVVLSVTPTSSTVMITTALRGMNVGDYVELEGAAAPASGGGQR